KQISADMDMNYIVAQGFPLTAVSGIAGDIDPDIVGGVDDEHPVTARAPLLWKQIVLVRGVGQQPQPTVGVAILLARRGDLTDFGAVPFDGEPIGAEQHNRRTID